MKALIFGALLAAVTVGSAPVIADQDHRRPTGRERNHKDDRARDDNQNRQKHRNEGRHLGWQKRAAWQDFNRYDFNRYDPLYGNYQPNLYYRDGRYYRVQQLTNQDRIYRGSNGRYYCRRDDGTTGLITGPIGGSLLGRVLAPNGSNTLGEILGGTGGALIGRSIGRDGVRCN